MKHLFLAAALLLLGSVASAQLKVGTNPSRVNKSSILELESTRQGLLLPRIPGANLADAPLSTAPDGMIIYVPDSASLFIRKNDLWQKMSVDSVANAANWNVLGNAGLDSTKNFLGTTDQQAVIFRTNDEERLRLTAGGSIIVGNNVIPEGTDQVQVMVIDPTTRTLMQRTIAKSAFSNAIVQINGLRDTVQTFRIDSAVTSDITITSAVNGTTGDAEHVFNIPTQEGTSAVSRGFLSYNDWVRFDSAAKYQILATAYSSDVSATGLSINGDSVRLHPADESNPGGVSIVAQTFAGAKNVRDSLSVGLAAGTAPNSTFQVNGSMSAAITTVTGDHTAGESDNTILANTTTGAITVTLPAPTTIAGRIYTIKKIGTGGIDNALTILPTGGSIDGNADYIIYNDWTFVTLQTDGTNWYVIKK
ncbi:hypothetical protein ACFOTA_09240 [Chitinophaga sp. GCM10012297]|uniref:Uncharacterized protein n=1 Tax=Chitinophaga chungangae TaxID=2821488 RepID=A0ABS3YCK2_9BACT|nr:hypothetical protein [Chitinophaga chungangae]MBO9152386.1 hypothetical protein [Chitinophaga chungangae]